MTTVETPKKTNVTLLLETLESRGELDADQLEAITGIKKAIIVSTLFLANKRGQVKSRAKKLVLLEGKYAFSKEHEEHCKRLSRYGWEVPDIADKLGMTETYVETMLFVASAPKEVRDMVEKGMIDVINAVKAMKERGDHAVESLMAMLGAAPKADGKKCATGGQVYKFVAYKGMRLADAEFESAETKVDFAAQLAEFFTDGARKALSMYDSRCASRVVNLENFRGGPGLLDGDRNWRNPRPSSNHAQQ